jgi:RNA polymerase sigma-70 factor (ECF subfamily)
MSSGEGDAAKAAENAARRSYGKLVAFLAARSRDVAAAEDALSEAFAAALATWPRTGAPDNPEAWLMTVARRKLVDAARRRRAGDAARPGLQLASEEIHEAEDATLPDILPDRRLALMFACAHPAIDESIRAPLILQTVIGLAAPTIASAFLTSPAAMAKRLVRAKEKIRQAGIPFALPDCADMPERLGAVLDAIYAAFSESWSDPMGADAARRDLAAEALFLGRLVAELMPDEPEALGLASLMLHAEARRPARRTPEGAYIPFAEQDVALWSADLLHEAETLLRRAGAARGVGRYELEAALQAAHVHRRLSGRSNWESVVQLYDALYLLTGSTVVAINRAMAIAELNGPGPGLAALPDHAADTRLEAYQPYWAARAELLARADARAEAAAAYDMAIGLEADPAVRNFLQARKSLLFS